MLQNLFKYTVRSFKRQRTYVIINILGLSTGIACSLLIALFVINEAAMIPIMLKRIGYSGRSLMEKSEDRRLQPPPLRL
jgi:hypothetical protein